MACVAKTALLSCAAVRGYHRASITNGQRTSWKPGRSGWPGTRRAKKGKDGSVTPTDSVGDGYEQEAAFVPHHARPTHSGFSLALRSEAMFSGSNLLNLPIIIWCGLGILWFLAFILGVHSVTYSPVDGVEKQVGLIWAPGWNIGDAIFLPIFLMIVGALLDRWKSKKRPELIAAGNIENADTWHARVIASWPSYWAIFFISFFLVFLVQWFGVYLSPLLKGDPDVPMIDWMLIALVQPETLRIREAIILSFLAFFYAGLIYWFLFAGLLLVYSVSVDFGAICAAAKAPNTETFRSKALETSSYVVQCTYRCAVVGIMVALAIKLNAAYLVSDAEGIISWLLHDMALYLGWRDDDWGWIKGSPASFFTSFLLLFLLCFVFVACALAVKGSFAGGGEMTL